ncbi:MAG: METTL5 family protein [Sulfolobales archaeon]|nr:METTL5 family protein [Sulfolobales archaeon]MCX8199136.1 METTL5 family protein [Sulfolobales archaeon]MDW8170115.1 METTL5 family protein [Desulfurococcaceae archaeon]
MDKSKLELFLETTPDINKPKEHLEQYSTPSTIASKVLWEAYMHGDIVDKTIGDFGCGSLRLALGALHLGARRAVGVEIDCSTLSNSKEALAKREERWRTLLVCSDVRSIVLTNVDTIVMNPPFGVKKQNRGLDMAFLKKALETANNVYTMHKHSSGEEVLVKTICEGAGFKVVYVDKALFPIKMTYRHHRRKVYRVAVDIYGLRRATASEELTS